MMRCTLEIYLRVKQYMVHFKSFLTYCFSGPGCISRKSDEHEPVPQKHGVLSTRRLDTITQRRALRLEAEQEGRHRRCFLRTRRPHEQNLRHVLR